MDNIKGLIFDYGGTLDTDGVHWFHIFRQVYARLLPQVHEKQLREAYIHAERHLATHRVIDPKDEFLTMLQKKVAIQLAALDIDSDELNMNIAAQCDTIVRSNMRETHRVLDTLSARYPIALVSNFYGNIHTVLRAYGIEHYFHEVIESAVAGIRKPNPQIFALAVNALGMKPEEIIVVGDSYDKDIVPAHSIGCHTVWLRGEAWDPTNEATDTSSANHTITTLSQVLDIV